MASLPLDPFAGLESKLQSRRETVENEISRLHRELESQGWAGPSAERYTRKEHDLSHALERQRDVFRKLEETTRQLQNHFHHELDFAIRVMNEFHKKADEARRRTDNAIQAAAHAVTQFVDEFADWPVKPWHITVEIGNDDWDKVQNFSGCTR
jgi:uncharacterized protein YukE